jgi:hypothetical protein
LATPVEITKTSLIGQGLLKANSIRVFKSFHGANGALYQEAKRAQGTHEDILINYGQTPYSAIEKADIAASYAQTEADLKALLGEQQHKLG